MNKPTKPVPNIPRLGYVKWPLSLYGKHPPVWFFGSNLWENLLKGRIGLGPGSISYGEQARSNAIKSSHARSEAMQPTYDPALISIYYNLFPLIKYGAIPFGPPPQQRFNPFSRQRRDYASQVRREYSKPLPPYYGQPVFEPIPLETNPMQRIRPGRRISDVQTEIITPQQTEQAQATLPQTQIEQLPVNPPKTQIEQIPVETPQGQIPDIPGPEVPKSDVGNLPQPEAPKTQLGEIPQPFIPTIQLPQPRILAEDIFLSARPSADFRRAFGPVHGHILYLKIADFESKFGHVSPRLMTQFLLALNLADKYEDLLATKDPKAIHTLKRIENRMAALRGLVYQWTDNVSKSKLFMENMFNRNRAGLDVYEDLNSFGRKNVLALSMAARQSANMILFGLLRGSKGELDPYTAKYYSIENQRVKIKEFLLSAAENLGTELPGELINAYTDLAWAMTLAHVQAEAKRLGLSVKLPEGVDEATLRKKMRAVLSQIKRIEERMELKEQLKKEQTGAQAQSKQPQTQQPAQAAQPQQRVEQQPQPRPQPEQKPAPPTQQQPPAQQPPPQRSQPILRNPTRTYTA